MTADSQSARRRGSAAPAMLLPGAALTCWLSELRIQAPVKRDAAKARVNWAARSDAARLDHGVPVSFPVAAGGTSGLPGTPSVGEPNHVDPSTGADYQGGGRPPGTQRAAEAPTLLCPPRARPFLPPRSLTEDDRP